MNGTWDAKSPVMAEYRRIVDEFAKCFKGHEMEHIKRDDNEAAGTLAKIGSKRQKVPEDVFLEHLYVPSIKGGDDDDLDASDKPSTAVLLVVPEWTQQYLDYLINKELPENEVTKR